MDLKTNVVFSGPKAKLVYDLLMASKPCEVVKKNKRKQRTDAFLKALTSEKK